MSDTPKVIPTAEHARNLERQLAAARRERDEAKSKLDAYIKSEAEHTDALAQKSAEALEGINALTAERDEARKQNTLFEEEMDAIRTVRDIARERCKKQEEQLTALAAERDRLREELAMAKADASNYKGANISKAAEISQIRAALATAQADIAKLCSVIAAAFAETAKPLNASVEYDATPTEGERLKKVQEILASAIDAADHGARDYQAAQAEAAEIERRYKWLLENIHRAQFGTGAGYDMEKGRVSLILNWIEFVKARPWDSRTNAPERIDAAVRAALDAASATEGAQP